jgi:hypothetical protein
MRAMKEGTTMNKLAVMLLGVLTGRAWLLPGLAEARLGANHNETLLADEEEARSERGRRSSRRGRQGQNRCQCGCGEVLRLKSPRYLQRTPWSHRREAEANDFKGMRDRCTIRRPMYTPPPWRGFGRCGDHGLGAVCLSVSSARKLALRISTV